MPYIKTFDRTQLMFCSWDSFVDPQSIARIIDAFVDSLDMSEYGVKEMAPEGRPAYDPRGLYKLHIYGNRKGIRSSRKLAESCVTNIEVKWLLGGVEPDFRTISDFRKEHISYLKKIFYEFNRRIASSVEWGFASVDGSKFIACNSKDNNFTKHKLDDRIKWLNGHTDEYLRLLSEIDEHEDLEEEESRITRENIERKLVEARERLERYEGYRRLMEETGVSQLSLTDADAKLMRNKNGFSVAYNPQTAVDSNTHLIHDFNMTNQATDHGLLASTVENIKKENPYKIIEVVADKGYENAKDMIACLEQGIIPHVIQDDGKDRYEFEVDYCEAKTDEKSTKAEELSKCLHAGIIPEAYKDVIEEIEIKEVRRLVRNEVDENQSKSPYGTEEDMMTRAKEGYFVRDPERNLVYCPNGEILRQKSIKANGVIRYANKNACKHCKNKDKCYKGKCAWKEIDFSKDKLEKPCKNWLMIEGKEIPIEVRARKKTKCHYEMKKIVKIFFKPNREKMDQRKSISEHPFGTIKRAMGSTHFLLKGMKKVEGEFALFCLGYNLERAKNLLGFNKLMELMVGV